MNEEKKIAGAILDAQKMREKSYLPAIDSQGNDFGEYQKSIEECLVKTCEQRGLSPNLWALLNLAMHWWNDIQLWAEDIFAGRNVGVEDISCCGSPSKDKCEQCQETGIANPLNQS